MKTTRHFDSRRPHLAFIMVGIAGAAKHRYGPRNFWKWSKKARRLFILKRWPRAEWVSDGTPASQYGGHYMPLNRPRPQPLKGLAGRHGPDMLPKAKRAMFLLGLSPKPCAAAAALVTGLADAGLISRAVAARARNAI